MHTCYHECVVDWSSQNPRITLFSLYPLRHGESLCQNMQLVLGAISIAIDDDVRNRCHLGSLDLKVSNRETLTGIHVVESNGLDACRGEKLF